MGVEMQENTTQLPCTGARCTFDKGTCPRHKSMVELVDSFLKEIRQELIDGKVPLTYFVHMWENLVQIVNKHEKRQCDMATSTCSSC